VAYQLVVDGTSYDVPDHATWLTDHESRVITATWLRTFFWNTLKGEPFGKPEFQTTVVGNGQPHIICTVCVTYQDRTAYGVGEAWSLNLANSIMKQYPALQARRRAESDAILAVLNIADRVYTDDQIPRDTKPTEPNGLQPKPPATPSTPVPANTTVSAPVLPAPETSNPEPPAPSTPKGAPRTSPKGGSKPASQPPTVSATATPAAQPSGPQSPEPPAAAPVSDDPRTMRITIGSTRSVFRGKTLGELLQGGNKQALSYLLYLAKYDAQTEADKLLVAAAAALVPEVEKLLQRVSQGRTA